ncbi:SurA N-terminal domain-containing protein [Salirhabdus salicampi]|uniref:SurA N-terminal domain-containing protein n=1 Tax=Salirhabdus salicampi TaxID=476102 RepID=UPI0020C4E1F4|nr:SurA N-terminal domain-containing protein [Salirhabdus salicampi]MCP8617666.1 SurA N-terminal domain-containing protein [Salirhabdus salicampi]
MLKKQTLFGVIIMLMILAACSQENNNEEGKAIEDDTTVATVNGMEIKGEDYNMLYEQTEQYFAQQGQDPEDEEIANQIKESALDQLIGQKVVLFYADQNGYEASEEEIEEQFDFVKSQYESDEDFADILQQHNLTEEKLRSEIANQIKTNQFLEDKIGEVEVTDEEIQEYYDMYKEQMGDEIPELEEVEEMLKDEIQRQKQQEQMAQVIENLKEDSDIEILI